MPTLKPLPWLPERFIRRLVDGEIGEVVGHLSYGPHTYIVMWPRERETVTWTEACQYQYEPLEDELTILYSGLDYLQSLLKHLYDQTNDRYTERSIAKLIITIDEIKKKAQDAPDA